MPKHKFFSMRPVLVTGLVFALAMGLSWGVDTAHARVSLTELEARIAELEAQAAETERDIDVLKGTIVMWSGEIDGNGHPVIGGVADTRWQVCDGSNGTPDLSDRFVIGEGAAPKGATGGSGSIDISIANLPSHKHYISANTGTSGEHTHRYYDQYWFGETLTGMGAFRGADNQIWFDSRDTTLNGNHTHSLNTYTQSIGSGVPIHHLPPYYVVIFLIYLGE